MELLLIMVVVNQIIFKIQNNLFNMEQIMPFIFGMLSVIGAIAIVIVTIITVKVFRHAERFKEFYEVIENTSTDTFQYIESSLELIHQEITSLNDKVQSQLDELKQQQDLDLELGLDTVNKKIDSLETYLESRIDDVLQSLNDTSDLFNSKILLC